MRKRKYDLVFGLGMACSCSEALRAAGLQLLSFPYDWLAVPAQELGNQPHELQNRVRELCDGFRGWFDPAEFEFRGESSAKGKDRYFNRRLGLVFLHDFPGGVPFAESFPEIQARYRRRANRLIDLIRRSRRVLVVRIDRPDRPVPTDLADCRFALAELSKAFSPVTFDFLQFHYEQDLPSARMRVDTPDEGLTVCSFDYRDRRTGSLPHQPDLPALVKVLRDRIAVRDYRTADERRAFAAAHRKTSPARSRLPGFLARWFGA